MSVIGFVEIVMLERDFHRSCCRDIVRPEMIPVSFVFRLVSNSDLNYKPI